MHFGEMIALLFPDWSPILPFYDPSPTQILGYFRFAGYSFPNRELPFLFGG
jgi:hypothetical protein